MEEANRSAGFARNTALEQLLGELNGLLAPANQALLADCAETQPKVFVVGALRSGTTLFMQWLAASGLMAYPSNLLSRFYGAPLVGAKIQLLLTDPRYNFRNEILDFTAPIGFSSENGKTRGALAPNEFWYFWRRFLPFGELDYLPDAELARHAALGGLRDELNALANIFGKPFALKAMILSQNIPTLAALFDKAVFVWLQRDAVFNVQSALEARQRQYGNIDTWYSFKIREYPQLKDLDPLASVAGQVQAINAAIEAAFATLPAHKTLHVPYEEFCRQPARYHQALLERLRAQGALAGTGDSYRGEPAFACSNAWRLPQYTQLEAELACAEARARADTERNRP